MTNKRKPPGSNGKSFAKNSASNVVHLSRRGNASSTPKSKTKLDYVWPDISDMLVDCVVGEREEKDVKIAAESAFRAANTHQPSSKKLAELDGETKRLSRLKAKVNNELLGSDVIQTTLSDKHPVKVNKIVRGVGWGLAALGSALVMTAPVIAAFAIEDSGLIDLVTENWLLGIPYGIAPLAGIVAAHNLRENVSGESTKRKLDMLMNGGAIISFAAWAYVFPATFLVDLTQGYGRDGGAQFSRATFYRVHLALEFFGSTALYGAAMKHLTHGAETVETDSKKSAKLEAISAAISQQMESITHAQAALVDADERFANASTTFTERQVSRWRAVKAAAAALNAGSAAVSRADIARILTNIDKESDHE